MHGAEHVEPAIFNKSRGSAPVAILIGHHDVGPQDQAVRYDRAEQVRLVPAQTRVDRLGRGRTGKRRRRGVAAVLGAVGVFGTAVRRTLRQGVTEIKIIRIRRVGGRKVGLPGGSFVFDYDVEELPAGGRRC